MTKHSDTAPDGKNARLAEKYIKRGESEKYYAREEVAEVCYRDIVCARAVRETRSVGERTEGKGAVVAATAKLFIGLASGELCSPCGADGAELNRAVQLLSARR